MITEDQINAVKTAIDYILIAAEHNAILSNKNEAVRAQKFEEAVKWRDEEVAHQKLMPTYEDLKTVREKLNQP